MSKYTETDNLNGNPVRIELMCQIWIILSNLQFPAFIVIALIGMLIRNATFTYEPVTVTDDGEKYTRNNNIPYALHSQKTILSVHLQTQAVLQY